MKKIKIMLSLILVMSLCSCGGTQLNKRLIVQNVGVDRINNSYSLSINAFSGSGEEKDTQSKYISKKGDTIVKSMENIALATGQTPFFSHNRTLIIGKNTAKSGISDILDFFMQYFECSPSIDIFLCEDKAQNLLNTDDSSTILAKKDIYTLSNTGSRNGQFTSMKLYQLGSIMQDDINDFCLPVLDSVKNSDDNSTIELVSTALFRKGYYLTDLTRDETMGYLILTNKLKQGGLTFNVDKIGNTTVQLQNSNVSIKPTFNNSQLVFEIKFTIDIQPVEKVLQNSTQIDEKMLEKIKNSAKNKLENNIGEVAQKCFENSCDPIGFCDILRKQQPEYWNTIKENYQNEMVNWKISFS